MRITKGMDVGRARWLAVFVVLLCASCAAPVLAESPKMGVGPARVAKAPAKAAEAPAAPKQEGAPPPAAETEAPAQGSIAEEVEAVESEEAAQDEWLNSPEAIRQREESRTAFDDLSAVDAEGVLSSVFEEALKQLDGDPARALSDMQIEEVVSENGALVSDGEGGMELVESPIPIRSKIPGSEGTTVDLALKETEGGFESMSPATDIKLPGSLGGQVEVGKELAFAGLPGNGDVSASRFGDKDLFYPNTETDTDTFIAPLARSVEVFQQLRSPKSPEQFRYRLTLPKDSTLRSDGHAGAEVLNPKGERVASVPTPFATDAQGTEVPVTMTIEDDSVVVEIAHRSMDVAYPLLLDPELVNDAWYWENTNVGLNYWHWDENADYEQGLWCTKACWGHGLYARSKGEYHWYGANTYGHWIYTAPNSTAYIAAATFWTIKGETYNCLTNQPHGYVGIYNVNSGSYNSLGVYSPPSGYDPDFQTGWVGGNGTRLAVVGIGTGSSPSQLACGHDFYVAGALLNQDDPEKPGVSVSGMPGGWISDTTGAFTLTANGSDPGLGVRKITFTREGTANGQERSVGCNGTAGSRCPVNRTENFNVSALSFDEGKKNAYMTVEDVTGKKSTQTWQTYVDLTKPNITLTGQLVAATKEQNEEQGNKEVEELSLPVYNLDIKATDIGTEQNADHKRRSGVRKIEVLLDGVKKQEWTQSCSDSCSMEKNYALKLNDLSADEHVLKVIATDGVGKKRERKIEFEYIPATGMKDEYVMHYFPLPDGKGNEDEEENPARPELAVNVMNGNLVYREKDVDVEGYSVDLEVERYYNSLLPEQENTEWGDGWTLAQTPDLKPEEAEGAPEEAMMVRTSGAVESSVKLPTVANEEVFDPELQAVVTKEADGGYEIADEGGETDTAIAFDAGGNVDELRTDGTAKIEYEYQGGDLTEIAVDDPASTNKMPDEMSRESQVVFVFGKPRDDPRVKIEAPDGLVETVEGEESGELVYEHADELLTSVNRPDGETEYEYDDEGRMTRVELANGTWAEVVYDESDGRVIEVTVDPEGSEPAKTTGFSYVDSPQRSTTVNLPNDPKITYEIGEDGSVFKWQNAKTPPEFEVFAGTLVDVENKETAAPINAGTYELKVTGFSEEGMESIQIYTDGDQLVSEKHCPEEQLCNQLPDEWVTETRNHAPGILNIEVVIEDSLEQVASKRFWVNIPYTPPPPPAQPVTPTFAEVLKFREEHGLDLDLDPIQDESELNDRVFDTINDWIQGKPVATGSMERWGAPLRTLEVAELEWRIAYWRQASEVIPVWATANAPSTFAGVYLDERAGGKIVVGFTGSQAATTLATLEQNGGLIAESDRIEAPANLPHYMLGDLESLQHQISAASYSPGLVQQIRVDIPSNTVRVGASNVSQAQSLLQADFGAQAPITIFFAPDGLGKMDARQRVDGAMRAGDEIWTEIHKGGGIYGECTASFGAFERGRKPGNGQPVLRMFVLAAAHCAELGSITQRRNGEGVNSLYQDIGAVRRSGYATTTDQAVDTDVAAIRLEDTPGVAPRSIYQEDGLPVVDITSVWVPTVGTNLCFSGRTSKERRCGPMISGLKKENYTDEEEGLHGREACFRAFIWPGDSGSPVWVEGTGVAVGVAVRGTNDPNDPEFRPTLENRIVERLIKEGKYAEPQYQEALKSEEHRLIDNRETCFVSLKPPPNTAGDGTVFGDPLLAPLHLVTRNNAKP